MKQGVLAAVLALASVPSYANIDTTGTTLTVLDGVGAYTSGRIGSMGQVFVPQAGEDRLTGFTLYLQDRTGGSGTLDLRGYVAGWDGNNPGSILFESATQTMNAAGTLQAFAFTTDILLNPGDSYIAYLSIGNLPAQPQSSFGMPIANDVIAGSFARTYYDTNTQSYVWNDDNPPDAWFQASFAAVPEPATVALLGFGLAALGLARRRAA